MTPLTLDQAVTVTAYTGFMICPFDAFHGAVEEKLGRPVFTHEMPSLREDIKAAFKNDFLALAPEAA